ncbi:platelet glycoprotein 4-like, partial [Ctenocephalides felis]|uniref:platelet glycoprotein 4-like n=1 Tax=Ctenocephalides felis TaxID=7515 RepID=UPI000E6E39EA
SITQSNVDASYFTRLGVNLLVRQTGSEPLVRMTAREFMFGYKTPLVTLGNNLLPGWIKFDKLGLIDRMYDFEGDYETVYTGETDLRMSGLLATYRGSRYLPHWPGNDGKCGDVNGASDGTKYASFIERGDKQKFFRKSMCRPADMVQIGDENVKGLDSYIYTFEDDAFDNGWRNPEHKCYCRKGKGRCLPDGLIDVTDCYYGFPIALSYPHFYKGDQMLKEQVNGTQPDINLHQTEIHIEPNTGMPVKVAVRLQINMVFTDLSSMAKVGRFSNMVLPMLWFEIGMPELPSSINNKFIFYLNIMPVAEQVILYGGFILGSIMLITSIVKVLMTVSYKGRSISDNFKQYNVPNSKSWLKDDNGKSTGKHIQGFKHQGHKSMDPISEKYLGKTSGSIYSPCEENFKTEAQSLIDIDKLQNTKKQGENWLNKSLGDILNKSLEKAIPFFSAENEKNYTKTPTEDMKEMQIYNKPTRKFSENKAFLCNEGNEMGHGMLKYGDVSENLSDLDNECNNDDLSESNSDDPYDYHKVPSASNSDNDENGDEYSAKINHGMV